MIVRILKTIGITSLIPITIFVIIEFMALVGWLSLKIQFIYDYVVREWYVSETTFNVCFYAGTAVSILVLIAAAIAVIIMAIFEDTK